MPDHTILTAQVVDGIHGRPAPGVRVSLQRAEGLGWATLAGAETDERGDVGDLGGLGLERGRYRIRFDTGRYFAGLGMSGSYPEVTVVFCVRETSSAHRVNLVLTPHSYFVYCDVT